ncbi:MAG: glutamate--tRNA ligase [Nanoarchaeota archaeon]
MVLSKEKNLELDIRKFSLANAYLHEGRAQTGAVLGKILNERPHLKLHIHLILPLINKTIKDIGTLNVSEQEIELREIYNEFFDRPIVHEKTLPELQNTVYGKVITRFAPSPSGPLHIGHVYVMNLNAEYAKKYGGKFILRIEDTNPENIQIDAYKMIPEDAKWATNNHVSKVIVQSSRMNKYYKWAKELFIREHAYVCFCSPNKWKNLVTLGEGCPERNVNGKAQLKFWKEMLNGKIKQGQAIVRLKTNMSDKNPAMRDFAILRINNSVHPKVGKKYRVWPLMNLAVAVDDHELSITHSIRGKDHRDNAKKQEIIQKYLGWKIPVALFVGRINFKDFNVSTTETRKAIQKKRYSGWNDVRLPFLKALKRRGYKSQALAKFVIEMGINENDKLVSLDEFFENLNSYNRNIIDKSANRYWFVPDPVKISVKNAPKIKNVKVKLHPDKNQTRLINTSKTLYIPKYDMKTYGNTEVRLMHLYNVNLKTNAELTSKENKSIQKIQWLPSNNIKTEVLMPNGKVVKGLGEMALKKLKLGETIQFERFGFVTLDKRDNKLTFAFLHV